mgnify:CR=1 FL=1
MPSKEEIRMRIWKYLEENEIALPPRPCYHKVPNFIGSRYAASRLSRTEAFRDANVVYVTPDPPLTHVQEEVLKSGKILVTSSHRLQRGFIVVEPGKLSLRALRPGILRRLLHRYGARVEAPDLEVDLFVIGSVAVTLDGARLGRGGGLADLEYGILRELNVIGEDTPIATIVHESQIVEEIPMEMHDVPVEMIATPARTLKIKCKYKKPPGVIWDLVSMEVVSEIPMLRKLSGFFS